MTNKFTQSYTWMNIVDCGRGAFVVAASLLVDRLVYSRGICMK